MVFRVQKHECQFISDFYETLNKGKLSVSKAVLMEYRATALVHERLTDRHFSLALGLYVLISFRNLLWVMWWMEESSILQDSLRPRSLSKQIFEQISIDRTSNQCRIQINTHNSTSYVNVALNTSFNGLQYILLN